MENQLNEQDLLNDFKKTIKDPDDAMMFDELLMVKKTSESIEYTISLFKKMMQS